MRNLYQTCDTGGGAESGVAIPGDGRTNQHRGDDKTASDPFPAQWSERLEVLEQRLHLLQGALGKVASLLGGRSYIYRRAQSHQRTHQRKVRRKVWRKLKEENILVFLFPNIWGLRSKGEGKQPVPKLLFFQGCGHFRYRGKGEGTGEVTAGEGLFITRLIKLPVIGSHNPGAEEDDLCPAECSGPAG